MRARGMARSAPGPAGTGRSRPPASPRPPAIPGHPEDAGGRVVFPPPPAGAAEDWTAVPPGRGFGNESTRGGTPQVVRVLPAADYRLASVEATLRTSGARRPVAHAPRG